MENRNHISWLSQGSPLINLPTCQPANLTPDPSTIGRRFTCISPRGIIPQCQPSFPQSLALFSRSLSLSFSPSLSPSPSLSSSPSPCPCRLIIFSSRISVCSCSCSYTLETCTRHCTTMTAIFPPVTRFVFTAFEPLSLSLSCSSSWCRGVFQFSRMEQTPLSPLESRGCLTKCARGGAPVRVHPHLSVVLVERPIRKRLSPPSHGWHRRLYTVTEAKIVGHYILALWPARIGKVAVACYWMEYERLVDVDPWNSRAWVI
ncbi:hypothetical protein BJ875DRAFT_228953 [Amylocarpus encephaloides]|uniref:DUF7704 domain-containing protein n=1 Tax=Amylocarpus encephaloides TaxID=45428 RepID=A0A9P8C0A5_9HELO|nr:hypothetical protein BJ875DRAFT_228953 [Amylocarpus encephaloides]